LTRYSTIHPPEVIPAPRKKKKYRLSSHTPGIERVALISFKAVFPVDSRSDSAVSDLDFLFGDKSIRSWNDRPTKTILITPTPKGKI
jgi:hypothetical protein